MCQIGGERSVNVFDGEISILILDPIAMPLSAANAARF